MVESANNYGINSLGGFVFQIDTFIYYALKLQQDETLEYESIEDVSIRRKEDFDTNEDSFRTNLISPSDSYTVIQVKHTNLTDAVVKKVLMNWVLLEYSGVNVEKYILFGISSYENNGNINDVDNRSLYNEIINNRERRQNSIKKKLKDIFNNNYDLFNRIVNKIKSTSTIKTPDSNKDLLIEEAKDLFHKDGVMFPVYLSRIKSLRSRIYYAILEAIKNKTSYKLKYATFRKIIESITNEITDEFPLVSFTDYKKEHPININKISNLREVKQLQTCNLTNNGIIRRIHRCNYYSDYQYKLKEQAKVSTIENIETAAYENFEDAKERLIMNNNDTPYERLTQTEDKSNSFCDNEFLKKGVCIYLTKDKEITGDKQVSWEDDSDEES